MFGIKRKQERMLQERLKFKCYEPINLSEGVAELLKGLNGKIVLLQSQHLGKYFHRGELFYDERDPEVLYLKNVHNNTIRKNRIHLHDITGLMEEI
jgi:hypothetical protein